MGRSRAPPPLLHVVCSFVWGRDRNISPGHGTGGDRLFGVGLCVRFSVHGLVGDKCSLMDETMYVAKWIDIAAATKAKLGFDNIRADGFPCVILFSR